MDSNPRRRSNPGKYVKTLKVDTTGHLYGCEMREFVRDDGIYEVQVAWEPPKPENSGGWTKTWINSYVNRDDKQINVSDARTPGQCCVNSRVRFLIFKEKNSGVGFRAYGVYERVFLDAEGEIVEAPGKDVVKAANLRYRNLYTMKICDATTPSAIKDAASEY